MGFSLRVLTVNTHKGFGIFNRRFILHELREAVRSVSADVVFLQEVLGAHEVLSKRHVNWPDASQYEFLADTIWSQFAYGQNAVYPEGHHGNALLSKLPIVRHENRDVTVSRSEKRGLLHCVLAAPGDAAEVHCICVHLGLREVHRAQQVALLCELVEREIPATAPLIIAGDFNDWRLRCHSMLHGCHGVREVFVEANGRAARTFPARRPVLPLDRIYVRNVRVEEVAVLTARPWSHLSDHAPLLAHLAM
ncbi:MAG: endonuclease/exonuclease/phosphatase family protein [Casimicrobiaceae bacterium]